AWSVNFSEPVSAGEVKLVPPHDALVLRGGRLFRYDLAAKQERWSVAINEAKRLDDDKVPLLWHEQGGDIWVAVGNKVVRYDGKTGEVAQEVPVGGAIQRFFPGDSAIAIVARGNDGHPIYARLDLAEGSVTRDGVNLPMAAKADR